MSSLKKCAHVTLTRSLHVLFAVVQMISGSVVRAMELKPISSIRFEVRVFERQTHFHLNMDEWRLLQNYQLEIGYGRVSLSVCFFFQSIESSV